MTHQQILEKAIQKAESNGYNNRMGRLAATKDGNLCVFVDGQEGLYAYGVDCSLNQVIFNHDFAKSLWPGYLGYIPGVNEDDDNPEEYWKLMNSQNEWTQDEGGSAFYQGELYKFHLQQMVIADDPIKYLGDHLDA